MSRSSFTVLGVLVITVLVAGCSSLPEKNAALNYAQSTVESVKSNPQVTRHTSDKIQEAEKDLDTAERLWSANEDIETVEHYAYLAEKKALTAKYIAERKVANNNIQQAKKEKDQIMLQVREKQLSRAEFEAAVANAEAQAAKREAMEAKQALVQLREKFKELEARETERGLVLTLGDVLFDVDEATLKPGAIRIVDKLAVFLREYPERNVLVEGFTDSTGEESCNQDLSERRALAVRRAIIAEGIAGERIQVVGYGEAFPLATNDTAAGRQLNRRVEVLISDATGEIPKRQ